MHRCCGPGQILNSATELVRNVPDRILERLHDRLKSHQSFVDGIDGLIHRPRSGSERAYHAALDDAAVTSAIANTGKCCTSLADKCITDVQNTIRVVR